MHRPGHTLKLLALYCFTGKTVKGCGVTLLSLALLHAKNFLKQVFLCNPGKLQSQILCTLANSPFNIFLAEIYPESYKTQ